MYEYLTATNAANYTPGPACLQVFGHSRQVDFIGIHHWGEDGQDFDAVVNYLASANARQSSAHEVIAAGRVACLVEHADASWAMADPTGYANARGVHLELRPEATDADYATAAERIADLRQTYGPIPLLPHRQFMATACPGRWDLGRLSSMADDILAGRAGSTMPAPAPQPIPAPPAGTGRRWVVDPGDTLGAIAGYYGLSIEAIAEANGIGDPDLITEGTVLVIPDGGSRGWTVDPGDTLGKIAAHYGVTVESISVANGIENPDRIYVGQYLQIP